MSSGEVSMDTIMEDEDSFVSDTDAIIYAASDISGWTQSLISDNNITNSSSSTSVDHRQQQISTAGGDSMIVLSNASSSWFNNYKQIDDQQGVRIFNVDFRALCNNTCGGSEFRPDTGRTVNEESSVRLVNELLMAFKITYRGDIVKFQLPFSSTKKELEEEVKKRFKISLQWFSIKYQDEDDDWISITIDSDLRYGMHSHRLLGRTSMRLLVTPEADT
ncbi:hypothetical protein H5410_053148 [Solanum commersonii]|uniref:PB1 domain-containing protein n=1 Tax=Solanum commersonii TaxID=4109 RepID=A0A9J5X2Q8_SOLCO|nr:hypothetical protein H5410_053148 [Solanum commersonii]